MYRLLSFAALVVTATQAVKLNQDEFDVNDLNIEEIVEEAIENHINETIDYPENSEPEIVPPEEMKPLIEPMPQEPEILIEPRLVEPEEPKVPEDPEGGEEEDDECCGNFLTDCCEGDSYEDFMVAAETADHIAEEAASLAIVEDDLSVEEAAELKKAIEADAMEVL